MIVVFVLSLLWAGLYLKTIKGFAELGTVDSIHWTIGLAVPIANIVVCCVQGFFAHRVYILSSKQSLGQCYFAICIPALVLRLALGIACAVTTRSFKFSAYIIHFRWLLTVAMASGAIVDIANTAALIICLKKGWTPHSDTQRIIDKLTYWTIGLPIPLFMYSNALFASLNWRILLRDIHDSHKPVLNSTQGHIQFRGAVDTITMSAQSHL
ncbi:hypothetical protein D9758_016092 [Tetrapyrgos nigripes]|uniref:Uncharacterized protein n=1 Tax=Tetrapyrgos nigripes TaxID=182062 RepID=A0A8H5CJG8_9AGAR|nr:hypothetical protein D9758_016092 [Tetrapyrgos nigripes]